jgi:HlyD family secretion protein
VRKGQVLARIYADIYALQRDEAASRVSQTAANVENSKAAQDALRATLRQAQLTYDRNKKLFDEKVISRAEFEQTETALRSAQANVNAAEQSIRGLQASVQGTQVSLSRANKDLSRTTLVAPMDGVVSSLKVKKGERVAGNSFNVGTEMMTVADMAVLEVRVDVGENDIVKISIGDSADVEVDAYNNRKFKGVVTKIASSTRGGAALATSNDVTNYEVRIRLDKSSYEDLAKLPFPFRPGMNATADIRTKVVQDVLAVPITAVNARVKGSDLSVADKKKEEAESKGEEASATTTEATAADELEEIVFVLQKDGTARKVVVRSGVQDINYIEILSGLKEGDQVITAPYSVISKTLKDGAKVKPVKKEELYEK